jgi:uncharacterized protein
MAQKAVYQMLRWAAMSGLALERPVWRRFKPRFVARAAEHVRAGGFAALVSEDGTVEVLLPDANGALTELGQWALLAIEQQGAAERVTEGAARGLWRMTIGNGFEDAVCDWCERDAAHPGPTRALELDCRACGACCREANVIVPESDIARWREAGRADLAEERYLVRDAAGVAHLRFLTDACQHLGAHHNTCAIYELRPTNCRAFVIGSEACLSAREDTLGLRDDGYDDGEDDAEGATP